MKKDKNSIHRHTINRRSDFSPKTNYRDYRDILVIDFQEQCGYCGKSQGLLYDNFHIDHFAPKSIFKEKKCDYTNLVLACPICNRNKSNKWIGNNPDISHNGKKGFIDPASNEYDLHLTRNETGEIIALSDVGKYMINELKFNIRPMSLMYKLEILLEKHEKLSKIDTMCALKAYRDINIFIGETRKILKFQSKE